MKVSKILCLLLIMVITIGIITFNVSCKGEVQQIQISNEYYGVGINKSITISTNIDDISSFEFVSDNPQIATVDKNGVVTGISEGSTKIIVFKESDRDNANFKDSCNVIVNKGKVALLNGTEELIKWSGRYFATDKGVGCYNTASGLEVNFYGTSLTMEMTSAAKAEGGIYIQTPAVCVLVDGKTDPTQSIISLSQKKVTNSYTIVSGLKEGLHNVRIYKTTEAYSTSLSFVSIETDGYFAERPLNRKYNIEVYGDSITTGHANMRKLIAEETNDGMQNGCCTYAWLAAEKIGADVSIMARNGIGLYSAWGSEFTLIKNWKKTYLSENDFLNSPRKNPNWETKQAPDMVILNIGTNDVWYYWSAKTYEECLILLCNEMFELYGNDTKIVLAGGMMTSNNQQNMRNVAETFSQQGKSVTYIKLPASSGNHPREADHRKAATVLAEHLKTVFGIDAN